MNSQVYSVWKIETLHLYIRYEVHVHVHANSLSKASISQVLQTLCGETIENSSHLDQGSSLRPMFASHNCIKHLLLSPPQ